MLYCRDTSQGLVRLLQHLEVGFIRDEEIKIRKKRVGFIVVATTIIYSLALSTSYDVLNDGLAYLYEKEHVMASIPILVTFIEAPNPRLRSK